MSKNQLAEITKYLAQLCDMALNETDPLKQDELTQEIDRVVSEKRRLESPTLKKAS